MGIVEEGVRGENLIGTAGDSEVLEGLVGTASDPEVLEGLAFG